LKSTTERLCVRFEVHKDELIYRRSSMSTWTWTWLCKRRSSFSSLTILPIQRRKIRTG
jgi:hypothetical protein